MVGLALTTVLLVADVLSMALLGHGVAGFLLHPVLTLSYPAGSEWPLPLWFVVAIPFLSFAGMAALEAIRACRVGRLFWFAVAARRRANAARLSAERSGAQQPSMQP